MTAAFYKRITDEDWKRVQRGRPKADRLRELADRLLSEVEEEREAGHTLSSVRVRELCLSFAKVLGTEEWNDEPLTWRSLVTLERCADFVFDVQRLLHWEQGHGSME